MESKTMEPKSIIYIDQAGDCWFVWLNTSNDSHLEHSFDSYEEAEDFAWAWAAGIEMEEEIECEVMLNMTMPQDDTTTEAETLVAAETAISFIEGLTLLIDVLTKFSETLRVASEIAPTVEDSTLTFKRLYLGSAYAYNILSRCRFLARSPKIVAYITRMIMRIFMCLPKKLVLRWPLIPIES